jgi:hypothetical protein
MHVLIWSGKDAKCLPGSHRHLSFLSVWVPHPPYERRANLCRRIQRDPRRCGDVEMLWITMPLDWMMSPGVDAEPGRVKKTDWSGGRDNPEVEPPGRGAGACGLAGC